MTNFNNETNTRLKVWPPLLHHPEMSNRLSSPGVSDVEFLNTSGNFYSLEAMELAWIDVLDSRYFLAWPPPSPKTGRSVHESMTTVMKGQSPKVCLSLKPSNCHDNLQCQSSRSDPTPVDYVDTLLTWVYRSDIHACGPPCRGTPAVRPRSLRP